MRFTRFMTRPSLYMFLLLFTLSFTLLLLVIGGIEVGAAERGIELAQTPPTSTSPESTTPTTLSETTRRFQTPSTPSTVLPTTTTLPADERHASRLVPGGQYGDFPLDAYDFMYSTNEDGKDDILGLNIPGVNLDLPVPASQDQGRRTVQGMIASWAFAGTVTIVKLALLIVGWAFSFPLLYLLGDLVYDTVQKLEGQFIGPAGIRAGVAVLAAFIAGWYLLTARLVQGLREVLISLILIALAGMVVSNVDRYYHTAAEFGTGVSTVIVGMAGSGEQTGAEAVQTGMASALVAEPWAILNFGRELEGACAQAGREILTSGPHGTSGTPRKIMRDAGCREEAAFNQDPTTERAIDAGLLFLGVLPAALFMLLVAFSLLIAQFRLAIAFVIAPGALLLGAVASTRYLAGRWALFAVKALLGIIAPVIVLSAMALIDLFILTGIDFEVTAGGVRLDLVAKLVLINAANLALWMKRKTVTDGIYRAATVKVDKAMTRGGVEAYTPKTAHDNLLDSRMEGKTILPGIRSPLARTAHAAARPVNTARAGSGRAADALSKASTAAGGPASPLGRGLGVAAGAAAAGATIGSPGRNRLGLASGGGTPQQPRGISPTQAAADRAAERRGGMPPSPYLPRNVRKESGAAFPTGAAAGIGGKRDGSATAADKVASDVAASQAESHRRLGRLRRALGGDEPAPEARAATTSPAVPTGGGTAGSPNQTDEPVPPFLGGAGNDNTTGAMILLSDHDVQKREAPLVGSAEDESLQRISARDVAARTVFTIGDDGRVGDSRSLIGSPVDSTPIGAERLDSGDGSITEIISPPGAVTRPVRDPGALRRAADLAEREYREARQYLVEIQHDLDDAIKNGGAGSAKAGRIQHSFSRQEEVVKLLKQVLDQALNDLNQ